VLCLDEFGPLNLMPHPGRHWAAISGNDGVRHLFAADDLTRDHLFGHVKPRKTRTRFLEFCHYLRTLYPTSDHQAMPPGCALGRGQQR
jgi:hypothetical protein